jgi:hypothetical protein
MYICGGVHMVTFLFCQPTPYFPFASSNSLVYLLGDPSSFARGVIIHPLSSLVRYQLSSPCCLTHPEGTPQTKLHIYTDDINNIVVPFDTSRNTATGLRLTSQHGVTLWERGFVAGSWPYSGCPFISTLLYTLPGEGRGAVSRSGGRRTS